MQGLNDAILVKSFPKKANTTPFQVKSFPPKGQHDAVFGKSFLPKRPTQRRFGDHFPPKRPTRRRFGDQVSHLGKTLDRPIIFFFSFLFMNNLNINKWVGSFKTNSLFAYFNFNFIKKIGLVGQLVSGRWANGFGLFLPPLSIKS